MSGNGYRKLFGLVFLAGLTFGIFSASAFSWNVPDDANVNSRYTVERVDVSGAPESSLSPALRKELREREGQKFSPEAFARLAGAIRTELKARLVAPRLLRGSSVEQVRVVLEVSGRRLDFSARQSRFVYHSQLGWSGELVANLKGGYLAIVNDGDQMVERYAGMRAGYSRGFLDGRVRPAFHFTTLHSQYHPRTLGATTAPSLYHHYETYQPDITITPWRGADREELTVSLGVRLQRFTYLSPGVNREASHALVNTLRYQRVWGEESTGASTVFTEYNLRAALAGLGSDFRYTRNEVRAGFDWRRGRQSLRIGFEGGRINGEAPLLDRFVYGNSMTLRGWNKLELAPFGATRAAASSVEYGRRVRKDIVLSAFWDAGSVWNGNGSSSVRHSSGFGFRTREGFFLYLAFPIRSGSIEPVLITGATF